VRKLSPEIAVIPPEFTMAALVLGAVLLLAAILGGILLPNVIRTALGRVARTAIAVVGVALMVWALVSHLPAGTQPAAGPAPLATLSARDLVRTASAALEACPIPTAPAVPDGATVSRDQMEAARAAFAAYDAATRTYTQCVDSAVARVAKQFADVASESDVQALNLFGAEAHNVAIDKEKENVDQFNSQLRAYNALRGK
jgi:hypothetical protein